MKAPNTFQRTLDILHCGFQCISCSVYIDDSIIYSKSFGEHTKQVNDILKVLQGAVVFMKLKKCDVFLNTVKYLYHII